MEMGNATVIARRDWEGEGQVWHVRGGHRGEEKVVRLEGRYWPV